MSDVTEQPPARRSTYLRSGAVALGVVVVIGVLINFFLLQRHTGATVDGHEIAQELSQAIQAKTGVSSPPQVACPSALPKSEANFNCTLVKGPQRVLVQVHRSGGSFTWTITNHPAGAASS